MKSWLTRFKRYAVEDGNLTGDFRMFLLAVVLAMFYAVLELGLRGWMAYIALMLAVVCGAVVAYSSSAKAKGLKPFTNDPLGWRKAKRTYYEDVDSDKDQR